MTELTIQVPDELAKHLQPLQSRLPELLQRLVESIPNSATTEMLPTVANPTASRLVYAEVLDFLISRPTPGEIAAFKVSEDAQARLGELLEKNREGTLNETASAELELSEQLDRLMTLLKAKAYAESIK